MTMIKLVCLDQGCCVAESWETLESFREELAWGSPASEEVGLDVTGMGVS